jgi:hypothetical protein
MAVMGSGALPPRHDDNLDRWFLQLPIQPLRTPPSLEPQRTVAELGQGREGELSNSTNYPARIGAHERAGARILVRRTSSYQRTFRTSCLLLPGQSEM